MRISPAALLGSLILAVAASHDPDVTNRFIVRLRSSGSLKTIASFVNEYRAQNQVESIDLNQMDHRYETVFNGFAGKFSKQFLSSLNAAHGKDIEYVVPDGIVRHFAPVELGEGPTDNGHQQQDKPPSWGQTRVSQRSLDLTKPYYYPSSAGAGVDVYIVDTGIYTNHTDFGGRAQMLASFVDGEDKVDGNGHGTHCSGTIGSNTYGLAKKVSLLGVKVLNKYGSGTWSGVISGVDFVTKHVRPGKTVMSMSLGGGKNQALNDAVTAAVKAGVVAIIASGNNGGDACQISPASADGAYAVMATDNTDNLASYSNRGKCTRIAGPGTNIVSTWLNGGTNTISGTSMATPHVAGVAALLMGEKQFSKPEDVYAALDDLSTKNAVKGMPADTRNYLLYNGAGN